MRNHLEVITIEDKIELWSRVNCHRILLDPFLPRILSFTYSTMLSLKIFVVNNMT